MKTSIIVMAAGFSKRMGCNKVRLTYCEETFLAHTLRIASQSSAEEVILVISPVNSGFVPTEFQGKVVYNTEADAGQSMSVKLGVQAAVGDYYLFLPIDQPQLTVADLEEIIAAQTTGKVVIPQSNNQSVNTPTLFSKMFKAELLALTGSKGGRTVWQRDLGRCHWLKVSQPSHFKDIDTFEDYNQLVQAERSERCGN